MLSALVKLDAKSMMSSALEDADVISVLEQAWTATRSDVKRHWQADWDDWHAANADSLFEAVQGLSDPSALTFLNITQKETYVSYNHDNKVWVYGSLFTSIPECGYVRNAQKLTSTTGEEATVVDSMKDGKRSIPIFFGESGSGKSVQAMLAPALKLAENTRSTVRVFSISLQTEDSLDKRLKNIKAASDVDRRNILCADSVVDSFIEEVRKAFPKQYRDTIVNTWLEDENRNTTALGAIVFIIDEIGKCLELARGVASARDAIYTKLANYCDTALLVLAGTSAAAILGPGAGSAEIASDPDCVSLVRVGDVQGDAYLQKLLDATLPLQGFSLSDVRSVNFLRPYLSNARTACILFEELRRFTEVPKEVDSDKVLQIWKRLPWDAGCYVPLRYRTQNGLQRVTDAKAREAIARNALKLLMHPDIVLKDDMPT
ncbi:unnamed protein product [Symbiodinium necroappetens]|uniref:Uncharacterized protein n=1 Tax=Symbiodinium necroappetens TaxID=1628268 RepID=A0A812ZYX0_9DINO|nr:unnamed protein product [Symbiodinium necroappetens]